MHIYIHIHEFDKVVSILISYANKCLTIREKHKNQIKLKL